MRLTKVDKIYMATEAKEGELTLIYNTKQGGYAVALTREQHEMLQLLIPALGEIQVVKALKVKYESR